MQAKLKKSIDELVDKHCKNKGDLSAIVTEILDRYAEKAGEGLIALFYSTSSFTSDGQLKDPTKEIKPLIASSIKTLCKRRDYKVLAYQVNELQEAAKLGFITCA